MTKFAVYANGTFWGFFDGESAAEAIQNAANEHGTIDIGQTQASTEGMTAEIAVAVLDDCTKDATTIGYATNEDEAAAVFMAYMRERMDEDDFATLVCPVFVYRSETSVVSPAYEPLFSDRS